MKPARIDQSDNLELLKEKAEYLFEDIYRKLQQVNDNILNFATNDPVPQQTTIAVDSDGVTNHEATYDHTLLHTQNTDTQLDSGVVAVDASDHVSMGSSELKIKTYSQDAEPTLSADQFIAFWIDTDDSNRVYLVYRRGSGDQVKVELT